MTRQMTRIREEWLAARLELLEAEKELTRRSDELARQSQGLPRVRVDKDTDSEPMTSAEPIVGATGRGEISRRMISERASAASLLRRLGAALRRQRGGDDRLVRVHVGDGRDADARRLDDVDGVDADARTDVARRRGVVPRHVGRDDGSDDAAVLGADAVALPPGRRQDRRDAPGSADRAGGRGVLLRVDRVRNGRLSAGRRAGGGRDAAAGAGARRSDRGRSWSS